MLHDHATIRGTTERPVPGTMLPPAARHADDVADGAAATNASGSTRLASRRMITNSRRHLMASRLVRIGVLGAGPIAQAAHLDAIRKAHNAELYALCDAATDLLERVAAIHQPTMCFTSFDELLADPLVDAVVIATADAFHVPLAQRALAAGKHVLIEKPLGMTIEECDALHHWLGDRRLVVQIGHNRRFDPGFTAAQHFVRHELGAVLAMKAWYHDSAFRYVMTDNLQPPIITSDHRIQPSLAPKGDRPRYLLRTHGSHLIDTARFLAGDIVRVQAQRRISGGSHCWFIAVTFAEGAPGHLELIVPVQGDFEEGFQIFGEHGSVTGRLPLVWHHRSSHVECFRAADRTYQRVLGEDSHTWRRQIEGFAATINGSAAQHGATLGDGIATLRVLIAVAESAARGGCAVDPAEMSGGLERIAESD